MSKSGSKINKMSEGEENSNFEPESFMSKTGVGMELKKLEDILQNAIKYDSSKLENVEHKYGYISLMIDLIKQNTDHIQSNILKSVILLIGATGAGKSTLLNYLLSPDNLVVSKTGKLQVKDENISLAKIGNDNGSTTLFPNVQPSSYGTFLDCPGEGDTRGIIAEVVDSILKTKISSNVEQVKILFVAPQASLGSEGSYGMCFKNALDKNAKFFQDIEHFRNSMAFVISCADVRKNVLENSIDLIKIILNEHANLNSYKDAVSHIISSKNIVIFSKPPEDLEFGDPYSPPSWNSNQREKIIEMIENLPFTPIPHKDFFHISTSAEVREVMSKALKIVETKARFLLKDLVEKASPFPLFAVELKPFAKYLSSLMLGFNTTLPNYLKVLAWNNYIKIKPNENLINKLNEEIIFLSQFVTDEKNEVIAQDWTKTADLMGIFTTTCNNTYSILSCPGNNFLKWLTQGNVTVKPSSTYAHGILENFMSLNENYRKKKEINLLGKDQNSVYFESKTLQIFSHNEDVEYKEKILYESTELYEEEELYYMEEKYTVKEEKFRPVTKTKQETYTELTPQIVQKEEEYEEEVPNDYMKVLEAATAFFTRGLSLIFAKDAFTEKVKKYKKVPVTEYVPIEKTREVSYQDLEPYEETVEKYKPVEKTRTVTKHRPVIKEKEVEKIRQEPIYKQEEIKEFNSKKFEEDVKIIDDEITQNRKMIIDRINMYPKAKELGDHNKDPIICIDEFDKNFEDLLELLQNAEYEAYFAQNPDNSLSEVFDIQTISKLIENIN